MLGNLYVQSKYWATGYSDGMHHAGGAKRRRYVIDGRIYWANERELPGLIAAIVERPVKTEPKPAKPAKRGRTRPQPAPTSEPPPPLREARYEALRTDFERQGDDTLLQALLLARARWEAQEDDDMTVLLLA